MSLRSSLLLTFLAGCGTAPSPSTTMPVPDTSDTGEPFQLLEAEPCTFSPDLAGAVDTIRVGPDGTLWAHIGGDLFRYVRDDSQGCSMSGAIVWQDTGLDAITDFDLDDQGRPTLLVFFDQIVRMSAAGAVEFSCEPEGISGAEVAVTGAGDRAYVVAVGDQELAWAEIGATSCAASKTRVPLVSAIFDSPAVVGNQLAVGYHEPGASLPPGVLLDLTDGSEVVRLGTGTIQGTSMSAMVDIAPVDGAFLVASFPDGDLWRVGADGAVQTRWNSGLLLGFVRQASIVIDSVAARAGQPTYLAASDLDNFGIWVVDGSLGR